MKPTPNLHYGAIETGTLIEILTANGRVIDARPVYAESYEHPGATLRNHLRILSKIEPEEVVKYMRMYADEHPTSPTPKTIPSHRLMAVLWYGEVYAQGFALEVFTSSRKQFAHKLVRILQKRFDGAGLPPIVPRYMKEMKYAHLSH